MNFKKRADEEGPSPAPLEKDGKKPVLIYIIVLFLAAFLLLAASLLSHRRNSEDAPEKLQGQTTAQAELSSLHAPSFRGLLI